MQRSPRVFLRVGAVTAISLTSIVAVSAASNVGAAPGGVAASAPVDGSATDQIIVTFDRPGRRLGQPDLAAAGADARGVRAFGERGEIVKLATPRSGAELEAVMQRLARRPGVELVEPDQIMRHQTTDTFWGQMWSLTSPTSGPVGIGVESAWQLTTGSSSVRVAVIDTGYLDHADLSGRFVGGYDFINDPQLANDGDGRDASALDPGDWITTAESQSGYFTGCQARDSSWHGTHVSGTIGANVGNGAGIAGINHVSKIVPVRVLGKCGGYTSDIVDGMRWSAGLSVAGVLQNPNPAKVLSLSLGGSGRCSSTYQNAINQITGAGAVVVVAAGNSNADARNYSPASCSGVITVASTGKAGSRAYYSNYGTTVELAAPGGDKNADGGDTILSTLNNGTRGPTTDAYVKYQGTSMATPHVTGVVSLMLSVNPALTPTEVTQILQQTATPFPSGSSCANRCGAGIVDAGGAVAAANDLAGGTTTTSPTTTSPTTTSPTTTSPTTTSPTTTSPVPEPGPFGKSSPADGASDLRGRIIFSWQPSAGATGYEVCLVRVGGACSWTAVGGTSASASGLAKGVTYEWQVRAVNGSGSTEANAGDFWTFSTR